MQRLIVKKFIKVHDANHWIEKVQLLYNYLNGDEIDENGGEIISTTNQYNIRQSCENYYKENFSSYAKILT